MTWRLGPKAGLAFSIVVAALGITVIWSTLVTQRALDDRGVADTGEVVATHYERWGRVGVDTIDVRVDGYARLITTHRFSGSPSVGERIKVIYDRDDPATLVEVGVSPWGALELLTAFAAVAGVACAVSEYRRIPKRRRRRDGPIAPQPHKDPAGSSPTSTPWAGKSSKRRGARGR